MPTETIYRDIRDYTNVDARGVPITRIKMERAYVEEQPKPVVHRADEEKRLELRWASDTSEIRALSNLKLVHEMHTLPTAPAPWKLRSKTFLVATIVRAPDPVGAPGRPYKAKIKLKNEQLVIARFRMAKEARAWVENRLRIKYGRLVKFI